MKNGTTIISDVVVTSERAVINAHCSKI